MKKATPVFVLSVIVLASFTGANNSLIKKNDCEALHLKGRIQSVSELLFRAAVKVNKVFKQSDSPFHSDSTWFDENGNKVNEKVYNAQGKIETEWTYKYDDNENLLEYVYLVKGKQRHKDSYTYDSAGRMTGLMIYKGADTLCEKDTYLYDSNGHRNEQDVEEHYPVKQNLKRYFKYDSYGHKLEENVFTLGRSVSLLHTWKYDKEGNMIEQDDYAQGRIADKEMFKYSNRLLAEKSVQLPDGSIDGKEVYTYNAKGYKTEYDIYNRMGKLFHYYTYVYDIHGNVIREKEFKVYSDGPELQNDDTYELTYDKKGNWIKKTDLKMDGTVTLAEREIQYY